MPAIGPTAQRVVSWFLTPSDTAEGSLVITILLG